MEAEPTFDPALVASQKMQAKASTPSSSSKEEIDSASSSLHAPIDEGEEEDGADGWDDGDLDNLFD